MRTKLCSWIMLILHICSPSNPNRNLVIRPIPHQPVHCCLDGYKIASCILPTSCIISRYDVFLPLDSTTWDIKVTMLLCYSLSWKVTYLLLDKTGNLVPKVFWDFFQAHYQEMLQGKGKKLELIGVKCQPSRQTAFLVLYHWTFLKNTLRKKKKKNSQSTHTGDFFICNINDSQEKIMIPQLTYYLRWKGVKCC